MNKTGSDKTCRYPFFIAQNRPTLLIGFMCAGKSILGKKLAEMLRCTYIDLDELLEERLGMSIQVCFSTLGEEKFRLLETELLQQCLDLKEATILATGGGIVALDVNTKSIKANNSTIFIKPSWKELWKRLSNKDNRVSRPILNNKSESEIYDIYKQRLPIYEKLANCIIDDDKVVAEELKEFIKKNGK